MTEEEYMEEAIRLAREGMNNGSGGPFGAVVVKDDRIIGRGYNRVPQSNDPTAHAEIMAIREACKHLGHFHLEDCTIFTSCEPCPMCLGAIYWAKPKRIVYAGTRQDAADAGFDDAFIYEELHRSVEQRKIPTRQILSVRAAEVFKEWKAKVNKVNY